MSGLLSLDRISVNKCNYVAWPDASNPFAAERSNSPPFIAHRSTKSWTRAAMSDARVPKVANGCVCRDAPVCSSSAARTSIPIATRSPQKTTTAARLWCAQTAHDPAHWSCRCPARDWSNQVRTNVITRSKNLVHHYSMSQSNSLQRTFTRDDHRPLVGNWCGVAMRTVNSQSTKRWTRWIARCGASATRAARSGAIPGASRRWAIRRDRNSVFEWKIPRIRVAKSSAVM